MTPNTTYWYRVYASIGSDDSANSNTGSGTTLAGDAPTHVVIVSIETGTLNIGQGNKRGTATVTLVDNNGSQVGNEYTVEGQFGGGSFSDIFSDQTDSNGVVYFETAGSDRGGVDAKWWSPLRCRT